jgi:hypothetical protein
MWQKRKVDVTMLAEVAIVIRGAKTVEEAVKALYDFCEYYRKDYTTPIRNSRRFLRNK